ncbi:MAG: CHASE domain-containing protein [Ferrovibrio sp.]
MISTAQSRFPQIVALALGIATLMATAATYLTRQAQQAEIYRERFAELAEEYEDLISERFQLYEYGLRGARGPIVTALPDLLSRPRFEAYVATREQTHEFPGARGVGYIHRVPADQVTQFVEAARKDGFPSFAVRELSPNTGERFIITYIYPLTENGGATGLDIASEANRRTAAMASARSGQPQLTAPITLVQASGQSNAGFLVLLPVYRDNIRPADIGLREVAVIGWTYSPLVVNEVLGDLGPRHNQIAFAIRDEAVQIDFYKSRDYPEAIAKQLPKLTSVIELFGRTWKVQFRATPEFMARYAILHPAIQAAIVAGIGLLLTLVAYGISANRERKHMAREHGQRYWEQIANSLPQLVWTCDPQGNCNFLSRQWEAYTGIPVEEQLDAGWLDQVHPDDRDRLMAAWQHSVATAMPFSSEYRLRRHDDDYRRFYTLAQPLLDADGKVLRWVGSSTDIEDRYQAEQHVRALLEEMEERVAERTADLDRANRDLQNLLDSLPSMITYWGRDQIGRIANNARDNWYGVSSDRIPGMHLRDLLGEQMYDYSLPFIEAVLRGERQVFEREMIARDGVTHVGQVNYVPDIKDGEVLGFYALIFDVTTLRAPERAQATAREAAEQATRAKSVFLTSMSHELRTPMNSILGFSDLLLGQFFGKLNDKQLEYTGLIRQSGEHLLKLMDEVLELSKIEAGRVSVSIEPVGIAGIIKSAAANLQPLAEKYQVAIDARNAVSEDMTISADLTRMAQVLINLGSNAIKYNKPGGWVKFRCEERPDKTLRIMVSDNGRGIPQDRQASAFQAFNRLGAEHGSIEGTGIGLALVKNLVGMMGGNIGFTSTEGEGSTFWVDMPIASAGMAELAPELAGRDMPAMPASFNGAQILYIEDNENNRTLFRHYMSVLKGVKIIEAEDGPRGITAARTWFPDLIFLDINLPGMNGFEVLEELKADPSLRNIPVVALTANAMEGDAERALQKGFTRYLSKPVRLEEVMRAVYDLLQADSQSAAK